MAKRPKRYYRPDNMDEALALLSQPDTWALGGGTKLLADDLSASVVDLQDLKLDRIELKPDYLHVGAMTRLADLERFLASPPEMLDSAPLQGCLALLRQAIRRAGPNTYRNAATVGGSIAARLADSELLAVFLLLNGELSLLEPEPRQLSLGTYLGAQQRPGGLITELRVECETGDGQWDRVARTPADYPIVSVATWRPRGEVPRLAATGIDSRPIRLSDAESKLASGLTEEAIVAAATSARARTRHSGDFRGDNAYRAEMAATLTRRVLTSLSR
ncbi:MAG: FAD binding domain-containing protein [Candidatus Promineifilaceae bacterium]|nr:FAD binding domain-containing protein [Candidatus Promineifilaceae bacterium]